MYYFERGVGETNLTAVVALRYVDGSNELIRRACSVLDPRAIAVRLPVLALLGALCGWMRFLRWRPASTYEQRNGCFGALLPTAIGIMEAQVILLLALVLCVIAEDHYKAKTWKEGSSGWCVGGALLWALLAVVLRADGPVVAVISCAMFVSIWPSDFFVTNRIAAWKERYGLLWFQDYKTRRVADLRR